MRPRGCVLAWMEAIVYDEAMKRAGKNLNVESFVDSLERVHGFDTGGLCGPPSFTHLKHVGAGYMRFFKADGDNKI